MLYWSLVNKEKVPSYPEEEEGDIDPLLDDKEKEDQGGDGGGNDDQELGQDEVENKARDLFGMSVFNVLIHTGTIYLLAA